MQPAGKGLANPRVALAVFLALYTAALAFGWLRATPSNEELYGSGGRFLQELAGSFKTEGGIPWWSTHFMQGHSMANFGLCVVPLVSGLACTSIFGDPAGIKIAALAVIPLAAFTMFLFVRRLTRDEWTAAVAAVLYVISAQMLLRLASFEHWMGSYSYIFPPLIFWAFMKVASEGSWRASAWLAVAWSGMMLSYAKLTFMLAPLALMFFVWLLLDQPARRVYLVRGTLVALVGVGLMSVVLLLPLAREYQWVAAFNFDPFTGWQQSFSMKSFLSVLDRDAGLLAGMRADFAADRGQFYLGVVTILVIGALFWGARRQSWFDTRGGVLLRLFIGIGLLALWLSQGPYSVFALPLGETWKSGVVEFLSGSIAAPPWLAALMWVATLVPPFLVYTILPKRSWRPWVGTILILVYLFVPGFVLLEKLPLYRDIRAPWGFWEVGFFSAAVAGALALRLFFSTCVEKRDRLLLGLILLLIALFDSKAYIEKFFDQGLPAQLFTDFEQSQNYLKNSLIEGRVHPMSGRYYYLRIPSMSGRGLDHEASWAHFGMRGMRALLNGAQASGPALQTFFRIGGVSHIFLDKTDPGLPPEVQNALAQAYPTGFDSDYVRILENRGSLAPAFVARDYINVQPDTENYAAALLAAAGGINAVPIELPAGSRMFPFLAGTATPQGGVQVQPQYSGKQGQPFRKVPYAARRVKSSQMVFDPSGTREGWLVVTEAWHPDWQAYSDGELLPIYRAFGGLMAVPLGLTKGPIMFQFVPPAWYNYCVYIAAASWSVVLGLLLLMSLPFVPEAWREWWIGTAKKTPKRGNARGPVEKAVVVIPTYNERESIGRALDMVLGLPRKLDVLVVDDGSPDGTADVVRARPEFGKRVHLLTGQGKSGLGTAYRRGFAWAKERGYDAAVEMDADLSHDPADVPKLLEALEKGAHLAVGSRYLGGISVLNWPQSRLFISTFGGFYVRTLTALPMSDPTSGFKAIRREVLEGLDWSRVRAEGYAFQIELHHSAWKQGFTIKEVPIVFTERREGNSKMSTAISLEAAWRVLRLAAVS